jgi:leader peptidase (prepilin peptidase)/N-methyltransferase
METLTLVFVAVAGLVFGSFFNVVIYRLPRGLNLSRPPSACPGCHEPIKPYDNIPVLSYLVLRGKCRKCGHGISPIYPAVEALTAAGFVLVYFNAGRELSLAFFAGCLFTSALIVLAFIDARHQILPEAITFPGIALALAYSFFRDDLTVRGALLGAVVGAGFLLLVYGAYKLIRKKEGLGMGDVTMMLMVGAYLGAPRTLLVLILASFTGALFGIWLIARRGKDAQFALPFGTFIAPAAFVAMIWGAKIVEWYLSRLPH